MKMMDDIRRNIWNQILEKESKTISLEDQCEEESFYRYKQKYIKCGHVFICLEYISFYLSLFIGKEVMAREQMGTYHRVE
jgi:hypothetical protein